MIKDLREATKTDWQISGPGEPSIEQLKLGCLLRIADGMEKMAGNYDFLLRDRDYYKRELANLRITEKKYLRKIASLKGWVKRKSVR